VLPGQAEKRSAQNLVTVDRVDAQSRSPVSYTFEQGNRAVYTFCDMLPAPFEHLVDTLGERVPGRRDRLQVRLRPVQRRGEGAEEVYAWEGQPVLKRYRPSCLQGY